MPTPDELPDMPGYQDAMARLARATSFSWADPIPALAFPEGVRDALCKAAERLGRERAAAESKLTEEQFVQAMAQALACGDFLRLVRADDGGQAITYEPFRAVERLKARIRELETELARERALNPVIAPLNL